MDLKEIGINMRNCVDSAQDMYYWRALLNMALNLQVPKAMELVIKEIIQKKNDCVWQVIGRLELGAAKSTGSALHHWNEVCNSPRRQIAEWHKLRE